jgi:hypothetical protein
MYNLAQVMSDLIMHRSIFVSSPVSFNSCTANGHEELLPVNAAPSGPFYRIKKETVQIQRFIDLLFFNERIRFTTESRKTDQ